MLYCHSIVNEAWKRSNGLCECKRTTHDHKLKCNKKLSYDNGGKDGAWGAWEAHHITAVASGGNDTLSNCEILCIDCHKKTRSYGR